MANVPKYIPPHLRQSAPAQDQQPSRFTTLGSTSRWQGERPSSSGSKGPSSRPSSSASSIVSPGPQALLQAHGDSFVGPLKQLNKVVDVYRYSGATAKGLRNEKSEQQVGRRLVECLDRTRPERVLLQFGNVDINISSVYRLETSDATAWDEKQFVTDVWTSYDAFLRARILPRLEQPASHASNSSDPPRYIRQLYICKATLPVVGDEALPESHAKYQYPKKKDGTKERSAGEERELQREAAMRMERVRLLVKLCGIDARRRMTADFNASLEGFASLVQESMSQAEVHVVDLNRHIRTTVGSDEVAAPYVTADPTNLHVAWETTLPFWIQELASAGLRTYDMPTTDELEEQWAEYATRKKGQMEVMSRKRRG